jgi:EAL domain-containing protein (putative c-di-GMP-specific phosphodiesterase class I)
MAKLIAKTTRAHGIDPSMLQIELTEGTLFERREGRLATFSFEAVSSLRTLGVHVALDDFGTGFSSLSLLKHCRVDSLKIDRSFVRDLVNDPGDLAIVGAIIAMSRHLNIPVTAEGIESWQQLAKVRELGCQFAQGHLFAKPMKREKILSYLQGEPIDLRGLDPSAETMQATALNPALLDELLMTGS